MNNEEKKKGQKLQEDTAPAEIMTLKDIQDKEAAADQRRADLQKEIEEIEQQKNDYIREHEKMPNWEALKPLDENFKIRREDYYGENGGIIFPNPNAPTAVYEDLEFVEDILKHNPEVLVIVDEAYIDFGGVSARTLIDQYDNLLVVQTFSKSRSMAGMRIGFALGNAELIKALNDFKYSFNSYTMNQAALMLGAEAVKDRAYFEECVEKIKVTRAWTCEELKKLGFEFNEPMANFVFVTHPKYAAKDIFMALREQKIFVRYFSLPRIDNYLRITIGTDEEMRKLVGFLKDYVK